MKNLVKNTGAFVKRHGAKLAVGGSALMASAAHAVDQTAIQTAITAAETDATAVGDMVIIAISGLVVIGLVIGIVKKL